MAAYLPPGWPPGVHPPGSADFETSAVAWLLDVVPPDYRLYGVLRRHPVALATMARHHVAACVQGAREGYRATRTELGGALPATGVDAVLAAYRTEGRPAGGHRAGRGPGGPGAPRRGLHAAAARRMRADSGPPQGRRPGSHLRGQVPALDIEPE